MRSSAGIILHVLGALTGCRTARGLNGGFPEHTWLPPAQELGSPAAVFWQWTKLTSTSVSAHRALQRPVQLQQQQQRQQAAAKASQRGHMEHVSAGVVSRARGRRSMLEAGFLQFAKHLPSDQFFANALARESVKKRREATLAARQPGGFDPERKQIEAEDDDVNDFEGPHYIAALLLFAVVGTMVFLFARYIAPQMSEYVFTMSVIMIYVATSVGIDIFISIQKEEDDDGDVSYAFDPICVVITTEMMKLVISIIIYTGSRIVDSDGQPFFPPEFDLNDVKWLALPAVLFSANNILIYYVILKNDISTFGIFRDTTILWTALMWKGWFHKPLRIWRILGIMIIFMGLAASEISELLTGTPFTWTFLWVCLLTLVNSLAGVSNEYAFKMNYQIDLNLQNIVLYLLCICFAYCTLICTNPKAVNPHHFYDGFTRFTMATSLLQAFGGLIVSRVLKYADAVTKTVAACLRGPTLILIAPLVLTDDIGVGVIVCSFVIAFGCFIYLYQGPMNVETVEKEAALDDKSSAAEGS